MSIIAMPGPLTEDNYLTNVLVFRDRQAGVSVIYNPEHAIYTYNAYCCEIKLLKELFSVEFDHLDDALALVNDEFGKWDLLSLRPSRTKCPNCNCNSKGCNSCEKNT